jgi:hypothetical protein
MRIKALNSLTVLAVATWISGTAVGQDGFKPPKPTPQHKALAEDVGVWDAELFVFPDGSDEGIAVGKGVETNTMLPGGLWLLSEFKGELGGEPFEGRGQTGYDPKKAKFVGTWVDSMTPQIMVLEGTYDEKTKTATLLGEGDDSQTGEPATFKTTTREIDGDNRVFTLFTKKKDAKDSEFVKAFEMRYKKRRSAK